MHILNENSNEKLNRISLFFTESEAINLLSYLESLVKGKNEKVEFFNEDKKKLITIILYNPENMENLSPTIKKNIEDEG